MKLDIPANLVASGGIQQTSQFQIRSSAHAFKILSSGLYSDKIAAVLREIGCNAADAHIAGGIPNEPFEVHLPTRLVNRFYIRDFGPGMSPQEILDLYTTYFGSSKSQSNEFTGAFGLGSKSPFAYTDQFSVTSWNGGMCTQYVAFVGNDGAPNISKMTEEPMQPGDRTGLMVSLPIKAEDFYEFKTKLYETYRFFRVPPRIINGDPIKPLEFTLKTDAWALCESYSISEPGVLMGNVFYRMGVNNPVWKEVSRAAQLWCERNPPILCMKIGDVDIVPSREHLEFTPRTISALAEAIKRFVSESSESIRDLLAALPLVTPDDFAQARTLFRTNSTVRNNWNVVAEIHSMDPVWVERFRATVSGDSTAPIPPGLDGVTVLRHRAWSTRGVMRAHTDEHTFHFIRRYMVLDPNVVVLVPDKAKYKKERIREFVLSSKKLLLEIPNGTEQQALDFAKLVYDLQTVKLSDLPLPAGFIPRSQRPKQPRVKRVPTLEVDVWDEKDGLGEEDILDWDRPEKYYVLRHIAWGKARYTIGGHEVRLDDIFDALRGLRPLVSGIPEAVAILTPGRIATHDLLNKGWKCLSILATDVLGAQSVRDRVNPQQGCGVPTMYGNILLSSEPPVSFLAAHCHADTHLWREVLSLIPKSKLVAEAQCACAQGGVVPDNPSKPIRVYSYNLALRELRAQVRPITQVDIADNSHLRYPMTASLINSGFYRADITHISPKTAAQILATAIHVDEVGAMPVIDCKQLAA